MRPHTDPSGPQVSMEVEKTPTTPQVPTPSGEQREQLQAAAEEHERQIIQTIITAREHARGTQGTGAEGTGEKTHHHKEGCTGTGAREL